MAKISLLVAMARNHVIGRDNKLPWRLPADLKRFKQLTLGKPVIMGRKTYDSIIDQLGKLLPERQNIVVTHNAQFQAPGAQVATSLKQAIEMAGEGDEIFIIGGGQIFEESMPIATHIYLTLIDADVEGDAHFPKIDWNEWRISAREPGTGGGDYPFEFIDYQRIKD
jgi:dihydrofolate reductase